MDSESSTIADDPPKTDSEISTIADPPKKDLGNMVIADEPPKMDSENSSIAEHQKMAMDNGRNCCQTILLVVALIGCMLDILYAILTFAKSKNCTFDLQMNILNCNSTYSTFLAVLTVLCAFGYLLLIFAQIEHKPSLILLFFALKAIHMMLFGYDMFMTLYWIINQYWEFEGAMEYVLDFIYQQWFFLDYPIFVLELCIYFFIIFAYKDVKKMNQFKQQSSV